MPRRRSHALDRLASRAPRATERIARSRRHEVETASAAPERVHVVAEGETLYQISKKYYGSAGSWQKLAQANGVKPEAVKVGMKLRLPGVADTRTAMNDPAPSAAPTGQKKGADSLPVSKKPAGGHAPDAVANSTFKTYAVKPGDTLQGISRRMLGSPGRVAELMRINNMEDGDVLSEGATLKLPNS